MVRSLAVVMGAALVVALGLLTAGCTLRGEGVRDGFEAAGINRGIWATRWWNGHAGGITDQESRSGSRALRAVVTAGNARMYGRSGQATERSELLMRRLSRLGQPTWYRFSVYVPATFPVRDVRLVMGQWKQSTVRLDLKRSPVVAQRFRNGRFSITINTDEGRRELYATGSPAEPALIGTWTDFAYRIEFATDEMGRLDVWMDGRRVVSYRGPLGYRGDFNYVRFRLGLYRDAMEEPMEILFDDVRVAPVVDP